MIETSRYTAVVLEKPERYIGGKDAVKLEVTFKPTSERYDYTNNYFIKNGNKYNRAYRLLSFVTTDFSLTLWYDADNSSGDRLQVQVKSETTTVDDVETSEPFGNLFEDGQVHTVGFEYTSTGYVRYWIDGVQQSKVDKFEPSGANKKGAKGLVLSKFGYVLLGNNIDLDEYYWLGAEYHDVKFYSETINEEDETVFTDIPYMTVLDGDIDMFSATDSDSIELRTHDYSSFDMDMLHKGLRKGRFNKKDTYRKNDISTPDLEAEARALEESDQVSEDVVFQNISSTVIVRT